MASGDRGGQNEMGVVIAVGGGEEETDHIMVALPLATSLGAYRTCTVHMSGRGRLERKEEVRS